MSVISEITTILSAGATLVEATGVSGARIRQPPTNDPIQFRTQLDTRSPSGIDAGEYVLMSRPAPRLKIYTHQITCFDHRDDP